MDCVVRYFEEFTRLPGQPSSSLFLVERKMDQITDLVYERTRLFTPSLGKLAGELKAKAPKAPVYRHPEDESNDPTYAPQEDLSHLLSDDDDADEEGDTDNDIENVPVLAPKPQNEDYNHAPTRPGPNDLVRRWALSNFSAPVAGEFLNGTGPAWVFRCIHCGTQRRVPRTPGCDIVKHEPKPIVSTNLASHLRKQCKKIPQAEGWEATQARNQQTNTLLAPRTAEQSLGAIFASETPYLPPPPTILSPTIFRSYLIQGVVRDTFPLTFGEGEGMVQVFKLVNPLPGWTGYAEAGFSGLGNE
ncbi:hypothetical protein FRC08_017830 [Ceratobasidium sp. 394]|nr:hypothetical protein FRC08_017830 [Ceratobasidium sp. 394]